MQHGRDATFYQEHTVGGEYKSLQSHSDSPLSPAAVWDSPRIFFQERLLFTTSLVVGRHMWRV